MPLNKMNAKESFQLEDLLLSLDSLSLKIEEFENKLAKQHHISHSSLKFLKFCSSEQSVSCKEIAHKTGRSISRASRIIDRMVTDKILIRKCDPIDRRKCELKLSGKGQKIKNSISRHSEVLKTAISKNLNGDELEGSYKTIRGIEDSILQYLNHSKIHRPPFKY